MLAGIPRELDIRKAANAEVVLECQAFHNCRRSQLRSADFPKYWLRVRRSLPIAGLCDSSSRNVHAFAACNCPKACRTQFRIRKCGRRISSVPRELGKTFHSVQSCGCILGIDIAEYVQSCLRSKKNCL